MKIFIDAYELKDINSLAPWKPAPEASLLVSADNTACADMVELSVKQGTDYAKVIVSRRELEKALVALKS